MKVVSYKSSRCAGLQLIDISATASATVNLAIVPDMNFSRGPFRGDPDAMVLPGITPIKLHKKVIIGKQMPWPARRLSGGKVSAKDLILRIQHKPQITCAFFREINLDAWHCDVPNQIRQHHKNK
ncbi:hypothetical protein ACTJK9_13825 [Pseudomonas sp. 22082]|uniref:hypothetical protein n=1 Tax=Pseudomonas sp. 22082 TaxID=3453868 RepID=UPI003F8376D4